MFGLEKLELVEEIKNRLEKGETKEQIKRALIEQGDIGGWPETEINNIIDEARESSGGEDPVAFDIGWFGINTFTNFKDILIAFLLLLLVWVIVLFGSNEVVELVGPIFFILWPYIIIRGAYGVVSTVVFYFFGSKNKKSFSSQEKFSLGELMFNIIITFFVLIIFLGLTIFAIGSSVRS